jgi:hypothetical protein
MRFPKKGDVNNRLSVSRSKRQLFVRPEEQPDRAGLAKTAPRITREVALPFALDFNVEHSFSHVSIYAASNSTSSDPAVQATPEKSRARNWTSPSCVYCG